MLLLLSCSFRCSRFILNHNAAMIATSITPIGMPTPNPILAPVDSPDEAAAVGVLEAPADVDVAADDIATADVLDGASLA